MNWFLANPASETVFIGDSAFPLDEPLLANLTTPTPRLGRDPIRSDPIGCLWLIRMPYMIGSCA